MTICKNCGRDFMKWNYFEKRWDCPRCGGHSQRTNEHGNKKLSDYYLK